MARSVLLIVSSALACLIAVAFVAQTVGSPEAPLTPRSSELREVLRPGVPLGADEDEDEDQDEVDDEGPEPVGQETACCLPEGGCQDLVAPATCQALGGVPYGLCRSCSEVSCPPAACITSDESCSVPHDTPGCNAIFCCEQKCAQNPSCCTEAWDEECATPCIDLPAKVDCCFPAGACVPNAPVAACSTGGDSVAQCLGDADGNGIDEACVCGGF